MSPLLWHQTGPVLDVKRIQVQQEENRAYQRMREEYQTRLAVQKRAREMGEREMWRKVSASMAQRREQERLGLHAAELKWGKDFEKIQRVSWEQSAVERKKEQDAWKDALKEAARWVSYDIGQTEGVSKKDFTPEEWDKMVEKRATEIYHGITPTAVEPELDWKEKLRSKEWWKSLMPPIGAPTEPIPSEARVPEKIARGMLKAVPPSWTMPVVMSKKFQSVLDWAFAPWTAYGTAQMEQTPVGGTTEVLPGRFNADKMAFLEAVKAATPPEVMSVAEQTLLLREPDGEKKLVAELQKNLTDYMKTNPSGWQMFLDELKRNLEDWKSRLPGGKVHEAYRELPIATQLVTELPAWLAVSLVAPSAVTGYKQLGARAAAAPTRAGVVAARVGQAAVAPIAAYEWGIGKAIGLPIKGVSLATNKVVNEALKSNAYYLSTLARRTALNPAEQALKKVLEFHKSWLTRKTDAVIKAQMAARKATTTGARKTARATTQTEVRLLRDGTKATQQTVDNMVKAVEGGQTLTADSVKALVVAGTPDEFIAGLTAAMAAPPVKVAAEALAVEGGLAKVVADEVAGLSPTDIAAKGYIYNQAEKAWYKPVEAKAEVTPLVEAKPEVPTEPVTGEQAGMLGVPGKVVTQERGFKVATESMDDWLKVQESKATNGILRAEVTAQKEIADFIKTGKSHEDLITDLDAEIKRLGNEVAERAAAGPLRNALLARAKRHRRFTPPYAGIPSTELEARLGVYNKFKDDFLDKLIEEGKPIPDNTAMVAAETLTGEPMETISAPALETVTEVPETFGAAEDWLTTPEEFETLLAKPTDKATAKQIARIHAIASEKQYITPKGKMKPQYRRLAKKMTGKTSSAEMTQSEASTFIEALEKLPKPTRRGVKAVPPQIPTTARVTTENFFGIKFGEPTPVKYFTSQTYYATKLGVKPLTEPLELAKQRLDIEYREIRKAVRTQIDKLNKIGGVSLGERMAARRKHEPTKAAAEMRDLLDKYEDAPATLDPKKAEIFTWFRNLTQTMWEGQNQVRGLLEMEPIKYRKAYVRHMADSMAQEILMNKYPLPEGLKYWNKRIVSKKIFNPMELRRELADDIEGYFTKDLEYAMGSMVWTALKEIHLSQPLQFFTEQMGALSKDLPTYEGMTAEEMQAVREVSILPASTKKWVIDFVNHNIKGQPTDLDEMVNRMITQSGLGGLMDKIIAPFGKSIGRTPVSAVGTFIGRLNISAGMGWRPKQLLRNAFQPTQNLALYGVVPTLKGFFPAGGQLQELLDQSTFLKGYTGYEDLPTSIQGRLERIWLAPYQKLTAVPNVVKAEKAAYYATMPLFENPKYKDLGWASPKRTYKEEKGFLYADEKELMLQEMELGAQVTQYSYIHMGLPEVFRHRVLIPFTRLQSWWMNHFAMFLREGGHRFFYGTTSSGKKLPWSMRVNWLKYLVFGGAILTGMGYTRSYLWGALPGSPAPAIQLASAVYRYAVADTAYQKYQAKRDIFNSYKMLIPTSLAWQDFDRVWTGEAPFSSLFFYGTEKDREKKADQAKEDFLKGHS